MFVSKEKYVCIQYFNCIQRYAAQAFSTPAVFAVRKGRALTKPPTKEPFIRHKGDFCRYHRTNG